jgi:p-cumate 2,3-dioxygenase beta subunit
VTQETIGTAGEGIRPTSGGTVAGSVGRLDQSVLEFVWQEAELLDQWRLREWAQLFTPNGRYVIPATDQPGGSPDDTLMLIDDDISRIHARVHRLLSRDAHADYPRPRTRRFVSNVLVTAIDEGAGTLEATAAVLVHSFRVHRVSFFVARCRYVLVRTDNGLQMAAKRVELDLEDLAPAGGTINIIV